MPISIALLRPSQALHSLYLSLDLARHFVLVPLSHAAQYLAQSFVTVGAVICARVLLH